MDYNVMAIIAIIASVGLLTVTIAAALPTMIAFAKGDKCISTQYNSVNTGMDCHSDKKNDVVSEEAMKDCRESEAKCSRSQTCFGEIGYFLNSNY